LHPELTQAVPPNMAHGVIHQMNESHSHSKTHQATAY